MALLRKKITSQLMMDRFNKLCEERPDLRVLLYILGPDNILEWIHSVGVCEDKHLRSFVPGFPPLKLRMITAAPELPEFLWTGLVDMERVMSLFESLGDAVTHDQPAILDFGCGCGRMTRFLDDQSSSGQIHGCEVNPDHVRWCNENLKHVKTIQSGFLPPLPYKDGIFNLVYSLSVFSHLPEISAASWLSEIHRILAPRGLLIATTHGRPALEIIRNSVTHQQMFNLDSLKLSDIIRSFDQKQFVFQKYGKDALENANAGADYGNAFIHPEYMFENWNSDHFKVVQHLPGGLRGWQDIVVIQKNA